MTVDDLKVEMDERFKELRSEVNKGFADMRTELQAEMDKRTSELRTELRSEMTRGFNAIADLISRAFDRTDQRYDSMETRFATQATRLDRHAGYWQTGRRWSGRMGQWAERIDKSLDRKDEQILSLMKRVDKLEAKD